MGGAEAKKPKPEATETKVAKNDTATTSADTAEGAKGTAKPKAKAKQDGVQERQTFERHRGSQWTLERCRKYARRYKSEAEWVAGSPASYKAASYWKWVEQCCEHMPTNLRLVHSAPSTHANTARTNSRATTSADKTSFKVLTGEKKSAATQPTAKASAKTAAKNTVKTTEAKDKKKKAS